MGGSFNHCINKPNGDLRSNRQVADMLENGGDVFEAVEEMYGMIWYMAIASDDPKAFIEEARLHYQEGLEASPTKRYKKEDSHG